MITTQVHQAQSQAPRMAMSFDAVQSFVAIANATNDMIHINDLDGRIIYVNPATERILGYDLTEVIHNHIFSYVHANDQEMVQYDFSLALTESHLPAREIRLLKKDGQYVDVEMRSFVITDTTEQYFVGAIIRDISERKKTEQELARYRFKLEKLVRERTEKLQQALDEIKTLRGIVPLCSFCKKIKDESGHWERVDVYIHNKTEADVSHSICPDCMEIHYPKYTKK